MPSPEKEGVLESSKHTEEVVKTLEALLEKEAERFTAAQQSKQKLQINQAASSSSQALMRINDEILDLSTESESENQPPRKRVKSTHEDYENQQRHPEQLVDGPSGQPSTSSNNTFLNPPYQIMRMRSNVPRTNGQQWSQYPPGNQHYRCATAPAGLQQPSPMLLSTKPFSNHLYPNSKTVISWSNYPYPAPMGKYSSNSGQNVQVSGSVATTLVASTALRQRASPLLMSASSSFIGNGQNFHLGRLGPKSMIGPNKSHSAIGMLSSSNNLRASYSEDGLNMMVQNAEDGCKHEARTSRSPSPVSSLQDLICQYIQYLIDDNEEKTQISKTITLRTPLRFENEAYYQQVINKELSFPTTKFTHWIQTHHSDLHIAIAVPVDSNSSIDHSESASRTLVVDNSETESDEEVCRKE